MFFDRLGGEKDNAGTRCEKESTLTRFACRLSLLPRGSRVSWGKCHKVTKGDTANGVKHYASKYSAPLGLGEKLNSGSRLVRYDIIIQKAYRRGHFSPISHPAGRPEGASAIYMQA